MRKALVALIVLVSVLVMGGKTYRPDCKGPTDESQAICIVSHGNCVWIDSGNPADCNE